MGFSLSSLLKYSDIIIQCHDNPDADALASGFALQWFFKQKGKEARFVYGGRGEITKSNLLLMIEYLGINVDYVTELPKPELLITVDCQYGESNVTIFDADNVVVIDHHQVNGELPYISDIRSNYGSCSTVVFELLQAEGYDINVDPDNSGSNEATLLATALYYGLMTDTNGFVEISHPADRNLQDYANYSPSCITLFRNSNYSREELHIAADALKDAYYSTDYSYSIIASKPCDPNILGLVSDMLLEVSNLETCLVYCIFEDGVKFSVRSCVKEVKANELAAYIAKGLGGGGGHLVKAGGFLKRNKMLESRIVYEEEAISKFFKDILNRYYSETIILYAGIHKEDISKLSMYKKQAVRVGFVHSTDLAKEGTKIQVRTLEGDVDITISDDIYIILGVEGEPYPIKKKKFLSSYKILDEEYQYPQKYPPTVIKLSEGSIINLLPYTNACLAAGGGGIYARELNERVKVFTNWDHEKYYLGEKGDYLAVCVDDLSDIYIVARRIFEKTYKKET